MTAVPDRPLVPLPSQPEGVSWPTQEWERGEAADLGADAAQLDALLDELVSGEYHPSHGLTHAAAVVAGGRLVAERYGRRVVQDLRAMGDDPPLEPVDAGTELLSWSMAKTITNLAVGVAVGDGVLTVDDPVADPRWQDAGDPRTAITWSNLLTMRAGLAWSEEYYELDPDAFPDVVRMLYGEGAEDMAAFAAGFALDREPGTPAAYTYSSGTTNVIAANLARALGLDQAGMDRFLHERIFDPIGMRSARAGFDPAGTYVGSSFTWCTLQDWCRFGLLLLRGGRWDSTPLLPDGWIDWSRLARSWDETVVHGAHLWAWDLPETPFGAHGFEGQRVICFPARDVVVVRLGKMGPNDAPALNAHLAAIARCFPTR
ncbi:serine hydrolase domain-containing protein [Aquihabitans daechungensis]|uniref:serine hydrolase domain-containing protein n=1 Tax=Aquihabitans daechungensis TaxID=1052257 RepID=UPI003B9E585D